MLWLLNLQKHFGHFKLPKYFMFNKFKTILIFSRKETVSIADIENIFKKKRHDKQTRIESVKVRHFILTPQASFLNLCLIQN